MEIIIYAPKTPNKLPNRHVRANLLLLCRLVDGLINAPSLLFQVNVNIPSRFTRSQVPFIVPTLGTHYGRN